jgi:hypothetical protein
MIIVRLQGGLGNQMFQYAAGRRLACLHNVPLKLDLSLFGKELSDYTPRMYALDSFSIQAEPATCQEIARLYEPEAGWVRRFVNSINFRYRQTHFREQYFHFDPAILGLPDNVFLEGYWQSDQYFKDINDTIRKEFSWIHPQTGRNQEIACMIRDKNSVSVHVRRGDFVNHPLVMATHGFCGLDYYQQCFENIAAKVDDPHFFIFSDDPIWVNENIHIAFPMTVIEHNPPDKGHDDMRLMSLCRHNIIANSSFSWWGAWLNDNPNKLVIAPKAWFNDKSHNTVDVVPKSWIQL